MIVNEIFYSLQGEGRLAGIPSVFIRLAGCPLRCKWCDTKYAWDKNAGQDYSIPEIIQQLKQYHCKFVVITGGEPMINPEIPQLTHTLKAENKHITIETAGIKFVPDLACDLMSISPKLSNSTPTEAKPANLHELTRLNINALHTLVENYNYQLKFVVNHSSDLKEIQQTISQIQNVDLEKVMLMPQAATKVDYIKKSPTVAQLCKQTNLSFCQRLHILLWDNQRQT